MRTEGGDRAPAYSPRERLLLRCQDFSGTAWETNESPPRPVDLLGECTVDPDVYVIRIEGAAKWLMSCGSTSDGNVIGTDIWLRETLAPNPHRHTTTPADTTS